MINRSTGDLVCDTCKHAPGDPSRGIAARGPNVRLNHLRLTAGALRKLAAQEGWRRDGGLDFCPTCAAGMPAPGKPRCEACGVALPDTVLGIALSRESHVCAAKCQHGSARGSCALCDFGVGEGLSAGEIQAAHDRAHDRVLAPAGVPEILQRAGELTRYEEARGCWLTGIRAVFRVGGARVASAVLEVLAEDVRRDLLETERDLAEVTAKIRDRFRAESLQDLRDRQSYLLEDQQTARWVLDAIAARLPLCKGGQ